MIIELWLYHFLVRILNSDGEEAERGKLGRIVVKLPLPPGNMSTLFRADDRFASVYFKEYPVILGNIIIICQRQSIYNHMLFSFFTQGYYDSMDAGIMDEDGQVYVMAREDDVINVAGHRLSTAALEEALLEHHCISEAAVIGVPDEMKGELPLGLYVTTKGIKK